VPHSGKRGAVSTIVLFLFPGKKGGLDWELFGKERSQPMIPVRKGPGSIIDSSCKELLSQALIPAGRI
jgi:hypothetical protein